MGYAHGDSSEVNHARHWGMVLLEVEKLPRPQHDQSCTDQQAHQRNIEMHPAQQRHRIEPEEFTGNHESHQHKADEEDRSETPLISRHRALTCFPGMTPRPELSS